ncbi:MAG TPA: hypothetical protein VGW34_03885 [Allosphingosinicella sp.]|nr:hypothetical protein [Allosphingosinicella sp.]
MAAEVAERLPQALETFSETLGADLAERLPGLVEDHVRGVLPGMLAALLPDALAKIAADQVAAATAADAAKADEAFRAKHEAEAAAEESDRKRREAKAFEERAAKQAERKAAEDALADFIAATAAEAAVSGPLDGTATYRLRASDGATFVAAPVEAKAADFTMAGGRAVYQKRIAFSPEAAPAVVAAVWLVGPDLAVRCEISSPLRAGGGAQAEIPAGHLIY